MWNEKKISEMEREILRSLEETDLTKISGHGKPLNLKRNPLEDKDEAASFQIYKRYNILPPEMQAKKELEEKRLKLKDISDPDEIKSLKVEISKAEATYQAMMDKRKRKV